MNKTANLQACVEANDKFGGCSRWRGEVRKHLNRTANLQVGHSRDENGYITNHTWATKKALFNYAAWIDVEFHDVVFEAFEKLTEGKTEEAQELANSVAKVRESLRKDHKHVTDTIEEACYSRPLVMRINHA